MIDHHTGTVTIIKTTHNSADDYDLTNVRHQVNHEWLLRQLAVTMTDVSNVINSVIWLNNTPTLEVMKGNLEMHKSTYVTPPTTPVQQPVYVTSPQPTYILVHNQILMHKFNKPCNVMYTNHFQQRQHQPTANSAQAKYVGASCSDVSTSSYEDYSSDSSILAGYQLN